MSQAGVINVSSVPGVPTSFVTDSGIAVPVLNVINVVTPGGGTSGITTSGAGNTITVSLNGGFSGTVTTNDGLAHTAATIALGAVPGTYTFDVRIAGYDAINSLSVGYTLVTAVRTTGAAAVLVVPFAPINEQTIDEFEEAAMIDADCHMNVSGNNAIIEVIGIAGSTINWKVEGTYTFVS